jgi:hypothetical protein
LRLSVLDEIDARGTGDVQEWRQASELKNGAPTHPLIIIRVPQLCRI